MTLAIPGEVPFKWQKSKNLLVQVVCYIFLLVNSNYSGRGYFHLDRANGFYFIYNIMHVV